MEEKHGDQVAYKHEVQARAHASHAPMLPCSHAPMHAPMLTFSGVLPQLVTHDIFGEVEVLQAGTQGTSTGGKLLLIVEKARSSG